MPLSLPRLELAYPIDACVLVWKILSSTIKRCSSSTVISLLVLSNLAHGNAILISDQKNVLEFSQTKG